MSQEDEEQPPATPINAEKSNSDLGTKKRVPTHRRGSSIMKSGHTPRTSFTGATPTSEEGGSPTRDGDATNAAMEEEESLNRSSITSNASRLGSFLSHLTGSSSGARNSDTSTGGAPSHHRRSSSLSQLPAAAMPVKERVFSEEDRQWEARRTMGGVEYYFNARTEQIVLRPKPDFLKTAEEWEAEENGGASVWVPHPTLVWQAAQIVKTSASTGDITVKPLWTGSGAKPVTVSASTKVWKETGQTIALWPLNESVLENSTDYDDLVALEDPNEAIMLHVLRERFVLWKKIYTWVGASRSVLISINPFQPRPELYGEESMAEQRDGESEASLRPPPPPHLFGLCKGALELCLYDQQNCSVLISGESGAGKTEATKYCLQFLSADSGQESSNELESKLVNANLLLEEFGNAKTTRNNNSSRFGKWIQVFYDMKTRRICNAKLTTFLLERSRVIFQAKGEANYHIFNLVLSNEYLRKEHGLTQHDWRYISNSTPSAAAASTRSAEQYEGDFKRILLSLTEIGLQPHEQEAVFQIIAAVLHLGQVDFETQHGNGNVDALKIAQHKRAKTEHRGGAVGVGVGMATNLFARHFHHGEAAATATTAEAGATMGEGSNNSEGAFHFQETCRLLGLESAEFETAACFRTVEVRGEKSTIPIKLVDARNSMDSLAMQLYGRLFDALLARINDSLALRNAPKPKKQAWIGLLDIFGFEIFEKNSFEQLCINFANEKLQQEFNSSTFKEEEGLYRFEDIAFDAIAFKDNLDMISLVEARGNGLFAILDDEVRVGGGSDSRFVSKFLQQQEKNPRVAKRKRLESALHFTLVHYAGHVKYDAQGFVQANVETFRNELHLLLRTSQREFIKSLFPALEEVDGRVKTSKKLTLSAQFRQQLNELMGEIQNTESRYIRCIKPNALGQANQVDSVLVMEQLRYSGIFETVDIRRSGYPFRKSHLQFMYQFQCIHPPSTYCKTREDDYRGRCEEICQNVRGLAGALLAKDIQIGKTRVLYRTKQHELLSLLRNIALEQRIVPWIQARLRGFIARQTKRICLECDALLKESLEDDEDLDRMEDAVAECEEVMGERMLRLFPAIRLEHRAALERKMQVVRDWNQAELDMEELLENDPREVEEMFYDLRKLLKRLDEDLSRENYSLTRRQERLLDELRDRVSNCVLQQQGRRFAEIQDQAREALNNLDRARMKELSKNFAEDVDIYQAGVQVFTDIAAKLLEMEEREEDLRLALACLHRERIETSMAKASALKLNVDEAKRVLALPAHEFCRLELAVAKSAGDERRRIHREIFLWEHEQRNASQAKDFVPFESLPFWRTPEEWVARAKIFNRLFRKDTLSRTFKTYTKTALHFPLTSFGVLANENKRKPSNSEPNNDFDTVERRKLAIQISKQLLPYFLFSNGNEDQHDEAVRQVLAAAVRDEPMRIELVFQILRMLQNNPDKESIARGERLLGMCLLSFALDASLEAWFLTWLPRRFGDSDPARIQKYWAALETTRYSRPSKAFNKNLGDLRQEWDALEISSFALQPGQSSGPSDPSQLAEA